MNGGEKSKESKPANLARSSVLGVSDGVAATGTNTQQEVASGSV